MRLAMKNHLWLVFIQYILQYTYDIMGEKEMRAIIYWHPYDCDRAYLVIIETSLGSTSK